MCSLEKHFLCIEWAKANPGQLAPDVLEKLLSEAGLASSAPKQPSGSAPIPPATSAPPTTLRIDPQSVPVDLFGLPLAPVAEEPVKGQPGPKASSNRKKLPLAPYHPVREIPDVDVRALEQLGLELTVESPQLPPITLVPSRTSSDRLELTYREAATLRLLVDAIPCARLIALTRPRDVATPPKRDEPSGPIVGSRCPDCGLPQRHFPESGYACEKGHGYGDPTIVEHLPHLCPKCGQRKVDGRCQIHDHAPEPPDDYFD